MAKVKYNVVMHGASGRIGDLLEFRQRFGKTIIAKIGSRSKSLSAAQQSAKDKFLNAVAYAKSALKNPATKEIYELKAVGGVTAYNNAVKDFFNAPAIVAVNTDSYSGAIGDTILVNATDDTKVTGVTVQLFGSNGNLLESGNAEQSENDGDWVYVTTVSNADAGGRIVVEARDLARNTAITEIVL